MFLTFEGVDGCGKTTQLRLLAAALLAAGKSVTETVEPGGTGIGRQIRRILLDPANSALTPRAELLLYFASRAQNVAEVITPALALGGIVLCDRFTDSTRAYQGAGRGLDSAVIEDLDRIACNGLQPDRTILIDIPVDVSLARARSRNLATTHAEARIDNEPLAFHTRVREAFLTLAAREPARFLVIDGCADPAAVHAKIRSALGV